MKVDRKNHHHHHQTYLQQTTCSIFTGRYLDRISEVLLIKHLWRRSRTEKRGEKCKCELKKNQTSFLETFKNVSATDGQCSSGSQSASCSATVPHWGLTC